MANNVISPDRLRIIEGRAEAARKTADDHLMELGLDPGCDADAAVMASTITLGSVDPSENLEYRGHRLAGLLVWEASWPTILYEAYDPPVRQRFSIAHELGHYLLHVGEDRHPMQCSAHQIDADPSVPVEGISDIELEADAFAAAFLMPAQALRQDIELFGLCVSFLAARYVVSEAAVRRRLRTLERLKP